MESQLDKLGRNLKSDEYWTSTTIYRPSKRNQSELYLLEVHGNLTRLSFLSSRTQWNRKRVSPLRANMLFVSINFSLEKDCVVFSAFVNSNFSELRYYRAVRCSEGTLKLVVKRSLSKCQSRSQCFSLPIYFLQSFRVQYFASNHMSSQTIYPRLLPWHYNYRQYQNNIVHC